MCKLCDGTHVVHSEIGSKVGFHTCPNCGPLTTEQQRDRMVMIQVRLDEFEKSMRREAS